MILYLIENGSSSQVSCWQPGIRRTSATNADGPEIRIPELGVATMTRGGTVEVGGVEIQRRSWLYKEIARLFLQNHRER